MTLLETVDKLRELDARKRKDPFQFGVAWSNATEEHAPAMLAVLKCFQKGDGLLLAKVANVFGQSAWAAEYKEINEMIARMREAARRMEE